MATKNVVQPPVIKWLMDHESISYNNLCQKHNAGLPEGAAKIHASTICNNIQGKYNLPKHYEIALEKALKPYGYSSEETVA